MPEMRSCEIIHMELLIYVMESVFCYSISVTMPVPQEGSIKLRMQMDSL